MCYFIVKHLITTRLYAEGVTPVIRFGGCFFYSMIAFNISCLSGLFMSTLFLVLRFFLIFFTVDGSWQQKISVFICFSPFGGEDFQPVAVGIVYKVNAHFFVFITDHAHFFVAFVGRFVIVRFKG